MDHHIHVVLDDAVAVGGQGVGVRLRVAAGETEEAGAADDRHLAHVVERWVAAHHGERATVVVAFGEDEVHDLEESNFGEVRRGVEALRPTDRPRRRLRPLRQQVVHDADHAEEGPGGHRLDGVDDASGGGVAAPDDVVEEEVQVGDGLLLGPRVQSCGGRGEKKEEIRDEGEKPQQQREGGCSIISHTK